MYSCLECNCLISAGIHNFSSNKFGVPLCMEHQHWVENRASSITAATLRLYFALKHRGVPAELEKWDGYKHIDIAVVPAKVNIEVDGVQHNLEASQAMADLQRTYFSLMKGYLTLRIPNPLTQSDYHLEQAADLLVRIINERLPGIK